MEGIAIRFGCKHGLRLTTKVKIVRYYNALCGLVAHRGCDRTETRLFIINSLVRCHFGKAVPKAVLRNTIGYGQSDLSHQVKDHRK